MVEVLNPFAAQQALQHRRQLTVDVGHALVDDPLLAGRIHEEERVGVLDVERLGLVGQPVDVRRLALRDPGVVDAEELPQLLDLRRRAGEHLEVGAGQLLVGAQPKRAVAPRIDRRLGDHHLLGQAG
jgi:hypothetical protein